MRKGRRAAFWAAVAGMSLAANYGVEAIAEWKPQSAVGQGIARFAALIHHGGPRQ